MFSNKYTFQFNGSSVQVINTEKNQQLTNKKKVFLGRFEKFKRIKWGDKTIEDGLAIFEYGSIEFPNYRLINYCNEKLDISSCSYTNIYD